MGDHLVGQQLSIPSSGSARLGLGSARLGSARLGSARLGSEQRGIPALGRRKNRSDFMRFRDPTYEKEQT